MPGEGALVLVDRVPIFVDVVVMLVLLKVATVVANDVVVTVAVSSVSSLVLWAVSKRNRVTQFGTICSSMVAICYTTLLRPTG